MLLSPLHGLFLILGATLASAISAFAGGGGIILLPLLIFSGLSPAAANMTGTVALLPGLLATGWGYREVLARKHRHVKSAILLGLIGGTLGAIILLRSPSHVFSHLVPYLLALSTGTFIYSSWFLKPKPGHANDRPLGWVQGIGLFILAIYGGYWGGGIALMTLAVLTANGWKDLHSINATKSLFAAATNVAGVILFSFYGDVHWQSVAYLTVGTMTGGYLGAKYVQKLDVKWVRVAVAVYAVAMTLYFFLRF